jgi:hypothetical protein
MQEKNSRVPLRLLIKPDEKVCFNCKHLAWMVALGLGVECLHPANRQPNGRQMKIRSSWHTCEHFESKRETE